MAHSISLIVSSSGLLLMACGDQSREPPRDSPPLSARAVIVSGDFSAGHPGVLSTLDLASRAVQTNVAPALAVGEDPILRHDGSELFIVNRARGNNVTILDDQTLQFKEQLGTGAGSNPQDVAVLGVTLFVPTFSGTGVVVLTRGMAATTTIDLSADDPDGKPNCNSAYVVGTDLYVSCGLLDDTDPFFSPRGPGKVYVVDTTTGRVRTTLTLVHQNPVGLFERVPASAPHGGDLVIPTNRFADGIGCVERITTGPTPAVAGCLVDNAALTGYVSRIAFQVDPNRAIAWLAVPTTFPRAELRSYDLATSTLSSASVSPTTQVIGDVVACPAGAVVVADRTMNANGLRVYNGSTEVTTAAIAIGLPPNSPRGLVCY